MYHLACEQLQIFPYQDVSCQEFRIKRTTNGYDLHTLDLPLRTSITGTLATVNGSGLDWRIFRSGTSTTSLLTAIDYP